MLPFFAHGVGKVEAKRGACCGGTMVIAVQGQIFSHNQQPMHLGWSMIQVLPISGSSGPGTMSMQSTGQTATQTSQPVQLSGLMSAFGRPFRGWGVGGIGRLTV